MHHIRQKRPLQVTTLPCHNNTPESKKRPYKKNHKKEAIKKTEHGMEYLRMSTHTHTHTDTQTHTGVAYYHVPIKPFKTTQALFSKMKTHLHTSCSDSHVRQQSNITTGYIPTTD